MPNMRNTAKCFFLADAQTLSPLHCLIWFVRTLRQLFAILFLLGFSAAGLATEYIVTSSADGGPGSLREAIVEANNDQLGAPHIVYIDSGLDGSSINLASDLPNIIVASEVNTQKPVKITINGANAFQLMGVDGAATVNLGNIALVNGKEEAGVFVGAGSVLRLDAVSFLGKGSIFGKGVVEKIGFSPIVMNQANTYSGGTVISQGTLQLANASALGIGPVQNSGSLEFVPGLSATAGSYTQTPSGNFVSVVAADCAVNTLNITNGSIFLAGTLNFNRGNGCAPPLGTVFNLLTTNGTASTQGAFDGLPPGAVFAQAGYTFKINYQGGNGNDVTLTVVGVPLIAQTINFPSIGLAKNVGDTAQLGAISDSNLSVSYSDTPGVCTISVVTVSFVGVGTCIITASQAGNATYSPAMPVPHPDIKVNGVPVMTMIPANGEILDFGGQAINSSVTKTVTVKNFGTANLTVAATAIDPANSVYVVTSNTCTDIPRLQSCAISITFTPPAAGARTAGLGVTPNIGAAQSVQLIGSGTLIPQTITFPPITSPQILGVPAIVLGATATSGLAVTYATTGPCSVTAGQLSLSNVGTCTVTASQSGIAPAGNTTFDVATAAAGTQLTQTITVNAIPVITSANTTTFTFGTPGSFQVTATGTPAATFSATNLPAGVVLNPTTGVLTSSATTPVGTTSNISITAQNSAGSSSPQTFILVVNGTVPAITSANTTTFTFGVPGSFQVVATGTPAATFSATNLPAGVVLNPTTGVMTSSATTPVGTTSNISITAQNSSGASLPQTFSLVVKGTVPAITSVNTTTFTFGVPGSFQVTATGTPAATFSATNLPAGVVLNPTTGVLSSTVATPAGTYSVNIAANNGVTPNATQTFSLIVSKATQTIIFAELANRAFSPTPFDISATPGASNTAISFTSATPSVCRVVAGAVPNTGKVTMQKDGVCSIKADQAASPNYEPATLSRTFTISPAAQVITFSSLTPTSKTFGEPAFSVSATSTGPATNPIVFSSLTSACSVTAAGAVTIDAVGVCEVAGNQVAVNGYTAATQVKASITINAATGNMTVAKPADRAFSPSPFSLSANPGASGVAVTFIPTSPAVCTVANGATANSGSVTMLTVGLCKFDVKQDNAGTNYQSLTLPVEFTISQAEQLINLAALPDMVFDAAAVPINVSGGGSANEVLLTLTTPTTDVCALTKLAPNSYSIKPLNVGVCSVDANQLGSANYKAAAPVQRTFQAKQKAQTITFAALANKTFGDADFLLTATASSGLPVSFASTTPLICTVVGSTLSIKGAGSCSITATQAGDRNYAAATPVTPPALVIAKAQQVIDFKQIIVAAFTTEPQPLSASSNNLAIPIVFTTITPLVCAVNDAASTVTLKIAGDCIIKANQAAGPNYLAAIEKSQTLNTSKLLQTISFATTTPTEKIFGDASFVITATGGASALPVTFTAAPAAVCTLLQATVTIVGAGDCLITASQAGNDNYNPSASVSKTVKIAPQRQVITLTAPTNKTFGDAAFTVSATGGASGLPILFSAISSSCSVNGNEVTTIGAGDCVIAADQAGNKNYLPAEQERKTIVVAKAAQTISFAVLPAKTLGDASFNVIATSSAGLPIAFISLTGATCEVTQNSVTIVAAGACQLQASQAGDNNFNKAVEVSQTFNVNPANGVISFSPLSTSQPKVGDPITFTVTIQPAAGGIAPTGSVTFSDNGVSIGAVPLVNGTASFTTSALTNGNHRITATYSGDANNKAGTSDVFGVTVYQQVVVTGGGGSSGSTGGGGGGCAIDTQHDAPQPVDPSMPLLILGALAYFVRRKYE